jgi:hypothetical protein
VFNEQIAVFEQQASVSFRGHLAARIYLTQPGLGPLLAARLLAEFGDDPRRYAAAKGRAHTAPQSRSFRAGVCPGQTALSSTFEEWGRWGSNPRPADYESRLPPTVARAASDLSRHPMS